MALPSLRNLGLEKLQIENLDTRKKFAVLFNPTSYSIDYKVNWEEQERVRISPELQYTAQGLKTINIELFVDTYEDSVLNMPGVNRKYVDGKGRVDVRLYTDEFARMMEIELGEQGSGNGNRPPILRLAWGKANNTSGFPPKVVLDTLKIDYVLFARSGIPVRARLNTTFKEFVDLDTQQKDKTRNNSWPRQQYTTQAGDSLSGIAYRFWGDPHKWRLIADANQINNPRILPAGTHLQIPGIT